MSLDYKLDFWIKNNQNALFIGKHGVGKTAMVKSAFERNKLRWKYFSAATMDPWVDFVGIPKETTMSIDGREVSYLKMIRPLEFALGEVEAIFIDEFNRGPKKVRNAVLELLQFKSINGEKFPNLRMIWAAVNPDDEIGSYDVERLDPAQLDRFEVHRNIEYKPDADYFRKKFGLEVADSAISWWNELDVATKDLVSPRRLEYALNLHSVQGDLRDVLPMESGVSKLLQSLKEGPTGQKLSNLMRGDDVEEARTWLQNENNFASATKYIVESKTLMEWFVKLMSKEKIVSLMSQNDKVFKFVISNVLEVRPFREICRDVMLAGNDIKMISKIKKVFTQNPEAAKHFSELIKVSDK